MAGVTLRASRGLTHLLRHQVFEARSRYLVVRLVHLGIGVEPRVAHDAVDEIIHHRGDRINAAESFIQ